MIGDYAKEKSTVRYSFKIFNFTFLMMMVLMFLVHLKELFF
jgi:hypothetical protein